MKFVGCKKAKEISLTKTPAVPRAVALVTKHTGIQQSENDDMDFKVIQRVASMSEVTKTHLGNLDGEEAVKAFLAKPNDEQDKEAADAKKAIDDAAAAAATAAAAAEAQKNAGESEAMKSMRAENEALKARLDAADQTREIEKMAGSPDFHGFPGGEEEVTKNLGLAFKAGGDIKTAMIESMKSQAKMAKTMGSTEFGQRSEHEFSKSNPATVEIQKAAEKMVADKEASNVNDAIASMSEMRKHADLFARADRERQAAAA